MEKLIMIISHSVSSSFITVSLQFSLAIKNICAALAKKFLLPILVGRYYYFTNCCFECIDMEEYLANLFPSLMFMLLDGTISILIMNLSEQSKSGFLLKDVLVYNKDDFGPPS